jgi:prepilin-type N-terminal cleavage/methylation domain-containing protein
MSKSDCRGFQLVELLVTLSILALLVLLAAPALTRSASGYSTRLAAQEVQSAMRAARAYAQRHATRVGVKFHVDDESGSVSWALYRDGDGDGVRTKDIESGIDPLASPFTTLAHFGRRVRFGFPAGEPPRDPSRPHRQITRLDDPIRFNRSDIASFSPLEGSTPGSVYITDGAHHLICVRLQNRSGRARLLIYDRQSREWRD